ncbi:MAG TPA: DUF4214 domain-containing protein, partial [Burkholderiaceae bacterium]
MASASSYSTLVQELYVAYFGRPADYFGLQNFEAALASANAPTDAAGLSAAYSTNAAVKSLVDSFGTSAESAALYGSGSTESFVTAIFENLLNRAPAVAGLTFWVNAINSGSVTKGDAALAIAAGAQANTTPQGILDGKTIDNKLTVAGNFTTDLGASSNDIVAYSGAAAAAAARGLIAHVDNSTDTTAYQATVQSTITTLVGNYINNTYTLTTGIDHIIGGPGNNAFNATLDNTAGLAAGGQASTLNSFDTITGGTLNNTLNVTDFGLSGSMATISSANITGITTLNISTLEGVSDDFSGWSTVKALNVLTATGGINLTADDAAVVTVKETSGGMYIQGGTTINVTNGGTGTVGVQGGATTTSVSVTGGQGSYIEDVNYGSSKAATLTTISITGVAGVYDIYDNGLTSLSYAGTTGETVNVHAAAGTRALALTLAGDVSDVISDNTATTVNVITATKASTGITLDAAAATALTFTDGSDLSLSSLGAGAAKAVTISGAGAFTADLSGLNAAAAVNATGATGVVTVQLASASGGALTQSFTGGSGQDIVTVGAGQTGTVSGGSATNNEIVLSNVVGATAATLAPYAHFSILGISGTTSGVFDMSKAAGYTAFDVQSSGNDVTFSNVAATSTLSIDSSNSHIITMHTVDTTGATDTAHVTLNVAGGSSITVAQITLEDSIHNGTGTVDLVANANSTITNLADTGLTALNISGAGTISINNSMTLLGTSLSINNTAGSSSSSFIGGVSDNFLTTLSISGSDGVYLNGLTSAATTLTISDSDAGGFVLSSLGDNALTSATFTNTVNTTAGAFNINGVTMEASLATLNLNGNVKIDITGDTVTGGITVAGGTDNAIVDFSSTGATATGKVDSITLGNGSDSVSLGLGAAGSTQTVVLGSGTNDSVTTLSVGTVNITVGSSTAGTDMITADSATTVHITAGNGIDAISATAAGASISISVGTGSNSVAVGDNSHGTI